MDTATRRAVVLDGEQVREGALFEDVVGQTGRQISFPQGSANPTATGPGSWANTSAPWTGPARPGSFMAAVATAK